MKKSSYLKILGLIIVSVCVASCAKEKFDTGENGTGSILGKWNAVSDTTYYYEEGKLVTMPNTDPETGYIQFASNGTGHDTFTSFTYTLTDKNLTLYYPPYDSEGTHYYADTAKAEIKSLTSSKLFIIFDATYKDDNGTPEGSYWNVHFSK